MVYKKTAKYRRGRKAKGLTVKKLNSKVNRMIATLQPELKVSESSVTTKLIGSLANPTDFMNMLIPDPGLTSGTSMTNQRVGYKIRIRSIQIKGKMHVGSNPSSTVRVLLIRCPEGLCYLPNYYLSNVTDPLGVISPFDPAVRGEIQVLMDKNITLNPFGNDRKSINYFKKVNFPVTYINDGTSVASGGLRLFIFSDEAAGSSNPVLDLYCRVRYSDL